MVTNPNPRDRPVVRSIMTIASVTVPCAPKTSRRSASVAEKGRFPIYNFILLVFVGSCYADGCFLECTSPSPEDTGAALPTSGEPALPESLSSNFDLKLWWYRITLATEFIDMSLSSQVTPYIKILIPVEKH